MSNEYGGGAPDGELNVPGQFVIDARLANLDRFFHKSPQLQALQFNARDGAPNSISASLIRLSRGQ